MQKRVRCVVFNRNFVHVQRRFGCPWMPSNILGFNCSHLVEIVRAFHAAVMNQNDRHTCGTFWAFFSFCDAFRIDNIYTSRISGVKQWICAPRQTNDAWASKLPAIKARACLCVCVMFVSWPLSTTSVCVCVCVCVSLSVSVSVCACTPAHVLVRGAINFCVPKCSHDTIEIKRYHDHFPEGRS